MPLPRLLARLVAQAKPAVPDALWPTLITLRTLAGSGAVIGMPQVARMLVLVAHPDDEAIACAGTIARAGDAGTDVIVVAATDGEATIGSSLDPVETGRRRRMELARSVSLLGARVECLGLPDGHLGEHLEALTREFERALDRQRPDIVLAPWLGDDHPDHRAVAQALVEALGPHPSADAPEVWGYESWAAVPHNRIVPIDEAIERKRAAIAAHETAALAFDLSSGLGLSRWRSMHGLLGKGFGEAFLALSAGEHVALAGTINEVLAPLRTEVGQ